MSEEEIWSITSCHEAACFEAEDRAFVIGSIREQFGSEVAFDTFVHTHLSAVLVNSERKFSTIVQSVAAKIVDLTSVAERLLFARARLICRVADVFSR